MHLEHSTIHRHKNGSVYVRGNIRLPRGEVVGVTLREHGHPDVTPENKEWMAHEAAGSRGLFCLWGQSTFEKIVRCPNKHIIEDMKE